MSWIYSILADEMVVAEQGSGAYINDERLQIKSPSAGGFDELSGFCWFTIFPQKPADGQHAWEQTYELLLKEALNLPPSPFSSG